MAFHPFQFFRKRQKTFLAALTILTMSIFIFPGISGGCDQRAASLFGRRGGDSTEVTKLYGKTVTLGDVQQVYQHRRMANAFVLSALSSTAESSLIGMDKE